MRVERMSLHHAEGRRGFYDVTLSLTNKGLASNLGGSSGDPGDFPTPPPQSAAHWYTFGFQFVTDGYGSASGNNTPPAATIPGSSTNTAIQTFPPGDYVVHVEYVADGDITSKSCGLTDYGGTPIHGFTMDSPEGDSGVIDDTFSTIASFDAYATFSAAGVSHAAHTVTVSGYIDPVGWDTGEGAIPPAPGQWVYGEVVTMSGDTGTTTWAYANGSLVVRVDGVPISRASYTEDGATGDFTLSWTPDSDEVVTVDYQGR